MTPPTHEGLFDLALERELLDEMMSSAISQAHDDASMWVELRDRVRRIDTTEATSAEKRLDGAAMAIRSLLLRRGHEMERSHLRSADLRAERKLPESGALTQAYERSAGSSKLESRLGSCESVDGWTHRSVAFSSGMAALGQTLMTARYASGAPGGDTVIATWSSYFETDALLALQYGEHGFVKLQDIAKIAAELGGRRPDILIVEPVRYNWELDVTEPSALVSALRDPRTSPTVLVVDKTLSPTWPTRSLMRALSAGGGPQVVFEVRSGLKLDQQGLEIANLGVVEVFVRDGGEANADRVTDMLLLARTTTGTGLSRAALVSLDTPFLLDRSWRERHGGAVLMQNAWFANRAADFEGGIIQEVVHPSLRGAPGGHAPFVVMKVATDDLGDHGLLLAAMRELLGEKDAAVAHGSSFGFRGTRYETIIPRAADAVGLFKVAVGSRSGPSLGALIDVMRHLSAFPSFTAMRRAMPSLKEVVLT